VSNNTVVGIIGNVTLTTINLKNKLLVANSEPACISPEIGHSNSPEFLSALDVPFLSHISKLPFSMMIISTEKRLAG